MKRVLITGGTGFVGANLARSMLADGHEVHLLVRPHHAPWRIAQLAGHVHLHRAELADVEGVRTAVQAARPDWIFHLAVYGAYPDQADLPHMIQTNIAGT